MTNAILPAACFLVRCPAVGGCLLAVALLLVSGNVRGQLMHTDLIDEVVIPVDSEDAYPLPFSDFSSDPATDTPAIASPDSVFTDAMDRGLANISPEGEPPVGVVDWVLVQARLAPDGTVPDNACNRREICRSSVITVTKAAVLLSDGTVADADDPESRVLTFEGIIFEPDEQDLYIVIRHRNHLPVMSGTVGADAFADDAYEYDFTDVANAAEIRGDVVRRQSLGAGEEVLTMVGGDATGDGKLSDKDVSSVDEAIREGQAGYLDEDVDLSSNMRLDDLDFTDRNRRNHTVNGIVF